MLVVFAGYLAVPAPVKAADPNAEGSGNYRGYHADVVSWGGGKKTLTVFGDIPRGGDPYAPFRFNAFGGYDVLLLPPNYGFGQDSEGGVTVRVGEIMVGDNPVGEITLLYDDKGISSGGKHSFAQGDFQVSP